MFLALDRIREEQMQAQSDSKKRGAEAVTRDGQGPAPKAVATSSGSSSWQRADASNEQDAGMEVEEMREGQQSTLRKGQKKKELPP